MKIEKTKWYNDADSPVVLMVDDFTNGWIDVNKNGKIDLGEDWGAALDGENSAFRFLMKKLIDLYPQIKATFFVPIYHSQCPTSNGAVSYFSPINATEASINFFRSIHQSENFEAAYHGYHHCHCFDGKRLEQEWPHFHKLDIALKTIEMGKEIFKEVFGEFPKGGKYCGYQTNEFSDESIDKSDFKWWCRKWNGGIKNVDDEINFNPMYFGSNQVVDLPSTITGDLFTDFDRSLIKLKIKKMIGRKYKERSEVFERGFNKIQSKIDGKQVISIQEHISPVRADGKIQFTNIIDDIYSLQIIFEFLSKKNVWYATCSEIAEYFDTYQRTIIQFTDNEFTVSFCGEDTAGKFISLKIYSASKPEEILTPDGQTLSEFQTLMEENAYLIKDFPIQNGKHMIKFHKSVYENKMV